MYNLPTQNSRKYKMINRDRKQMSGSLGQIGRGDYIGTYFWHNGHIHCLDCGNGFMSICTSQNVPDFILIIHAVYWYVNYTSKEFLINGDLCHHAQLAITITNKQITLCVHQKELFFHTADTKRGPHFGSWHQPMMWP